MVREVEEPIEVKDDEEDGNDSIGDKCLKMLTLAQLRTSIEIYWILVFFIKSDNFQRYTMEISKLIEKELSQTLKQACIKDYFVELHYFENNHHMEHKHL